MTTPPLPARCAPTASLKSREETSMTSAVRAFEQFLAVNRLVGDGLIRNGQILSWKDFDALLSDLRTMAEERDRLREALTLIADGCVPSHHQSGHYLAHRSAVSIARTALSGLRLSEGGGRISSSSDAQSDAPSAPVTDAAGLLP